MLQLELSAKGADRCPHVTGVLGRARAVKIQRPALLIRQQHLRQFRSQRLTAAASSDELGLVSKEEQSDGSILFVFGDEAQASKAASSAEAAPPAAQEAPAAPPNSDASPEQPAAEAVRQEDPTPEPATSASENSSSAADEHTGSAAAAASTAPNKEALQSKTVAELKELCRTYDLRGYTAMRKAELIDFVLENLGAPSS